MKKAFLCLAILVSFTGRAHGFGVSGSNGADGANGQDGRPGQDIVLNADGQSHTFYLRGEDGRPGQNGREGSNAYACYYSEGPSNEYGADGGDGGDGGKGGNGGRGGDLTVFYTDIKDLKAIFVDNIGGRGAPGGRGSNSGYGCDCSSSSWTYERCGTDRSCSTQRVCEDTGSTHTQNGRTAPARVCHNHSVCEPVTTCSTEWYSCSDGDRGRNGRDGPTGSDGRWGMVSLVKDLKELPGETPEKSLDIFSLGNQELVLSKQIWKTKAGAKSLFSPGSLIQDQYREFVRLARKTIKLDWRASSPLEDFKGNKVSLSFDGRKVLADIKGKDFIDFKIIEEGHSAVIVVQEAFKSGQVADLKIEGTTGSNQQLVISVKDKAGLSELVKNRITLQFVHKSWWRWWVVYDSVVPSEAIEIANDEIKIMAGKLGILPKAIQRGKTVRFTISIERTFGNNTARYEELFGPTQLY